MFNIRLAILLIISLINNYTIYYKVIYIEKYISYK